MHNFSDSLEIQSARGSNSDVEDGFSTSLSVPGKVILFGEHAVVYGKLAVAASLGLRTKLTFMEQQLTELGANKISINLHSINLLHCYDFEDLQLNLLRKCDQSLLKNINLEKPEVANHEDFREIIDHFIGKSSGTMPLSQTQYNALFSLFYLLIVMVGSSNVNLKPFNLDVMSEVTIGAGLGSSASVMVALAAAFYQYTRFKTLKKEKAFDPKSLRKKDLDLISRWAFSAEKIIHGTPSGLDNTICTFGSVVEFKKNSPLKLVELRHKLQLLLVNTKVPKDTKALVAKVAALKETYPDVVEKMLAAIENISHGAVQELVKLDEVCSSAKGTSEERHSGMAEIYRRLGDLVFFNQQLLKGLQVSHRCLDVTCTILEDVGLRGKLTGAGGGGYAFAIIPDGFNKDILARTVDVLTGHGFEAILTNVGGPGLVFD